MEELRTIVTSYMVVSDKGPLALGNKKEAEKWLNIAKNKGLVAKIKEVTTNTERLQEIGRNLFEISIPNDRPLIEFRNLLVSKMNNKCEKLGLSPYDRNTSEVWTKISKEYDLDLSFDEFHKCIMDKVEYGSC